MADIQSLAAEPRERAGKGSARKARREGRVPAVIYGEKKSPEMITLASNELIKLYHRGTFLNTIFEIGVGGAKQRVLPRDVQVHPVTDQPLHVDFLRLGKGTKVIIDVPVHFEGEEESPGLKRGGVLNIVRHEIECECPADSIPEAFTVSLEGLDIGDSIHFSAIELPDGVESTIQDRDFTVATIAAPTVMKTEEEEAAEAAEADELEGEEGESVAEDGAEEGGKEEDSNTE